MCDLGLAIGLVSGILQAAGAADAADKNQKMIIAQAKLDHAAQAREFVVEQRASNKEAYNAQLEADRNKSYLKTISAGVGSTPGARVAEQSRQGALSIQNAKDRGEAAAANYAFAGNATTIQAHNRIQVEEFTPLEAFTTIAGSAISNYGAFS